MEKEEYIQSEKENDMPPLDDGTPLKGIPLEVIQQYIILKLEKHFSLRAIRKELKITSEDCHRIERSAMFSDAVGREDTEPITAERFEARLNDLFKETKDPSIPLKQRMDVALMYGQAKGFMKGKAPQLERQDLSNDEVTSLPDALEKTREKLQKLEQLARLQNANKK